LICGSLISYKTTTGNLKIHLRNRHIESYRLVATAQASTTDRNLTTLPPPLLAVESIRHFDQAGSGLTQKYGQQTKLDIFVPKKSKPDTEIKN
jgi:hypothetical protein